MALTDTAICNAKEKPHKVAAAQGLYLPVNPKGPNSGASNIGSMAWSAIQLERAGQVQTAIVRAATPTPDANKVAGVVLK